MKLDIESIIKRLIPDIKIDLNFMKKLGLVFSKKKRKKIIAEVLKDLSDQLKKGLSNFKSLADNSPLRLKLQEHLNKDKIKGTEFISGFVSLDTGLYHGVLHSDFSTNEDFVNGVLASTTIPMVYDPIRQVKYKKEGELFISRNNIDGGVNNVSPLGDVVERINNDPESDYKIIIINCHNGYNIPEDYSKKNIAQIATRSLYEIAFTEIFNNDVNHFLKINDLVKQALAWDNEIALFDSGTKEIKAFDSVIIQPQKDVDLGNSLVANEKMIYLRLAHGKAMAREAFDNNIL